MNKNNNHNSKYEKPTNFKKTVNELKEYLKPYKTKIIVVIIFAILSAAFNIIGPKLIGNITTEIFDGVMNKVKNNGPGIDFINIGKIISILLVLYGLSSVFSYIQGFLMSGVSMKVSFNLRKEISKKINKLPLSYYDKTKKGEVLSRVTNDVDTLSNSLNQSLSQIIRSTATVIGVLIMMISISIKMTLVALLIIPISFVMVIKIAKKSQKHFKDQQNYLGNVNGHIEEAYSGHLIIKSFNREEESIKKFNIYNEKLYESGWKSQFLSSLMMPLMMIIGNLGYVALSILGGVLAAKNVISIGDIQAFIQYVKSFTQPLGQLASASNVIQQTTAAAERIFEFLSEKEEKREVRKLKNVNIKGNVEFENVNFGYTEDKIIINDFSAKVKKGEKIAIVGPTGAGKTTIVKLLMRFYELNKGKIKIDDIDITEFKKKDLRRNIGMVLQDTWLYNESIMENIRYGNLEASDKDVIKAAKAAHVDTFVHMLPNGYNMILNEEASNISEGQKQLITIARAILAEPKMLIFDEATSSVDTRTEVQIQKAMEKLMKNKTSFIIAHRLSTIKNSDLILVMDKGDIVEQGSHEELINKKGFYENLYNSQFEE